MTVRKLMIGVAVVACLVPATSQAGPITKAVREATEAIMRRFGREAVEEFGEDAPQAIAQRMQRLAEQHGEDVVTAAGQKVGPRMFRLIEQVGDDGATKAVRLMARQGDEAVWVIAEKNRFALFARLGDDAADAMIRHRGIADNLLADYGSPMARALVNVGPQNGRRLAMMADDGSLRALARRDDLLETIARYGDRAADFIWRNKGALAVGAIATAFVTQPEAFLDGAVRIVEKGGQYVVEPVARSVVAPATEAVAKSVNWTLILGIPVAALTLYLLVTKLAGAGLFKTVAAAVHARTTHPPTAHGPASASPTSTPSPHPAKPPAATDSSVAATSPTAKAP
ncbi:MAG: hypothetical protein ACK4PI_03290 [Tepidisphaerales bacterium]